MNSSLQSPSRASIAALAVWIALLTGASGELAGSPRQVYASAPSESTEASPSITDKDANVKELCRMLRESDASTDPAALADLLDEARKCGKGNRDLSLAIGSLLPENSGLYADRSKVDVVRLRAYLLASLAEVGVPDDSLRYIVDALANCEESSTACWVGAGARAGSSLGKQGRFLIPHLQKAYNTAFGDEWFSLQTFDPIFPEKDRTTVKREVVRAFGRICSPMDRAIVQLLESLSEGSSPLQADAGAALKAIFEAQDNQATQEPRLR